MLRKVTSDCLLMDDSSALDTGAVITIVGSAGGDDASVVLFKIGDMGKKVWIGSTCSIIG